VGAADGCLQRAERRAILPRRIGHQCPDTIGIAVIASPSACSQARDSPGTARLCVCPSHHRPCAARNFAAPPGFDENPLMRPSRPAPHLPSQVAGGPRADETGGPFGPWEELRATRRTVHA
jgi:hypothetical protein